MLTLTLEELKEAFGADSSASGEAVSTGGDWLSIDEYTPDKIVARTEIADEHTRKGGTVAGATIFRFFDAIGYLVTLAQSPKGTEGFTTDVSIHFLRAAPVGTFLIEGRPLKFGRRASVVAVTISSTEVSDGPVAAGVVTYAPIFPAS
ncbi:MAG: PaaI family thioesterase [Ilumatobacteraceae bacterium]